MRCCLFRAPEQPIPTHAPCRADCCYFTAIPQAAHCRDSHAVLSNVFESMQRSLDERGCVKQDEARGRNEPAMSDRDAAVAGSLTRI